MLKEISFDETTGELRVEKSSGIFGRSLYNLRIWSSGPGDWHDINLQLPGCKQRDKIAQIVLEKSSRCTNLSVVRQIKGVQNLVVRTSKIQNLEAVRGMKLRGCSIEHLSARADISGLADLSVNVLEVKLRNKSDAEIINACNPSDILSIKNPGPGLVDLIRSGSRALKLNGVKDESIEVSEREYLGLYNSAVRKVVANTVQVMVLERSDIGNLLAPSAVSMAFTNTGRNPLNCQIDSTGLKYLSVVSPKAVTNVIDVVPSLRLLEALWCQLYSSDREKLRVIAEKGAFAWHDGTEAFIGAKKISNDNFFIKTKGLDPGEKELPREPLVHSK